MCSSGPGQAAERDCHGEGSPDHKVLPPSAIKKPRHASGALEIIMIPAIVPLFKKKNLSDGAHYLRHLAALDSIPKFAAISEGCSNSEQRQRPRYGGRINEFSDWGLGNTYCA